LSEARSILSLLIIMCR